MLSRRAKIALPLIIVIIWLVSLVSFVTPVSGASQPVKLEMGGDGATSWNFGNIKPGDTGAKTVTLRNAGYSDGTVILWLSDIVNREGNNAASGSGNTTKPGDLGKHLTLNLSGSELSTKLTLPAAIDNFPQSASDPRYIGITRLGAGDTVQLTWQWELPPATGNNAQGDSLSFTINYLLVELPPPPSPSEEVGGAVRSLGVAVPGGQTSQTSLRVTPDGAVVESHTIALADNKFTLSFDSGTRIMNAEGKVGMLAGLEVELSQYQPPVPENMVLVSPVYDIVAHDDSGALLPVTFDKPVRLVISYDPQKLPENTASVVIAYYDEKSGWTQLEPAEGFVAGEGQVAAQVNHFSLFAVLASKVLVLPAPTPTPVMVPARFEVSNLDISPTQVRLGESITITARVVNTGELSGEHTVTMNINGLPKKRQVVKLTPGQSQEIGFTFTPSSPGTYHVAIDGLRGNFTVKVISTPIPLAITPNLYWLIPVILAVVAMAVLLYVRRRQHNMPL